MSATDDTTPLTRGEFRKALEAMRLDEWMEDGANAALATLAPDAEARAERAEAALAEAQRQEPVAYVVGANGVVEWRRGKLHGGTPLYAAPIPSAEYARGYQDGKAAPFTSEDALRNERESEKEEGK